MSEWETIDVLNRLLAVHCYSLPVYMSVAHPVLRRGDEKTAATIDQIAADQQQTAERIAEMIRELEGRLDSGTFPTRFTHLHDLRIDYLLDLLIEFQRRDVQSIEAFIDQLQDAPLARSVAEEALGAAKGHLESLEELTAQPAAS